MNKNKSVLVVILCIVSFFLGALSTSAIEKRECLEKIQNVIHAQEVREKLTADPTHYIP